MILDLVMKQLNGIDAAEKIGYEFPTTIILNDQPIRRANDNSEIAARQC
jgi:chemotaxis response regulator CheB